MKRIRILVLCTQNSCRSQIAEGLIRNRYGDRVEVFSAGAEPAERVHPLAVETLKQRGIDISEQSPKSISMFAGESFDFVITTCDSARASCPLFLGKSERIHWDIQDPASVEGAPEDISAAFDKTADILESCIAELDEKIETGGREGSE